MILGFVFAIVACLIWGITFVVPTALADFSLVEVVLGRYFTFGLFSVLLFWRQKALFRQLFTWKVWGGAALLALASNFLYYIGVGAGLRYASPPLTVLLVGLSPVTTAIYGNWKQREMSYQQMMVPCFVIALGVVLLNIFEIDWTFQTHSFTEYVIGFSGALLGLIGWTIYAVHNARFLRRHEEIPSSVWATAMGVVSLFWSLIFGLGCSLCGWLDVSQLVGGKEVYAFWGGVAILGFLCSWVGGFLWNQASTRLPVPLMGSVMAFQTFFGLLFVYLFQREFPSFPEFVGSFLMLGGVVLSVRAFLYHSQKINAPFSCVKTSEIQ